MAIGQKLEEARNRKGISLGKLRRALKSAEITLVLSKPVSLTLIFPKSTCVDLYDFILDFWGWIKKPCSLI